jgi:tRNA(Ile)-lysidine synthase
MLPVKQFIAFAEQNQLFGRDGRILAAVSGGMDSVLMVHLLKAAGLNFAIAHCNFQLRGDEALRDQEFCHNVAQQFRAPFHTINFDTTAFAADNKLSIQMAARQLRYDWFEQVRQQSGAETIALAHHQNDAIETILLNLTRGTGIAGMHGILPKNGALVRPLLFLNREEIQKLVDDNHFPYVEDSSNASAKYARNKLRLEVIPKLKELNPALEQTFERNVQHFRDLELLLEDKAAELRATAFGINDSDISIATDTVKNLRPQRLLLYRLLQEFGVNETIVDDVIASLDKHAGRVFETPGHRIVLDRDKLIISPAEGFVTIEKTIYETDGEIDYGDYKLLLLHDDSPLIVKNNPMAASVDAGLLVYPLTMRPWREGDRFVPIGMKTAKKLSDYFVAEKVPLHRKRDIPILVNGNGDIMWVGGYRPDERYKVSDKTKKVTIFELFKK